MKLSLKHGTSLPLLPALCVLVACQGEAPTPDENATGDVSIIATSQFDPAREAAQTLGQSLKAELVAAMREGGPSAAIHVCNERAPEIASTVSGDAGMDVGRTALRVRNPDNAPDAWETAQLESFLELISAGATPAEIEAVDIVETVDGTRLRWMKPIMMDDVCVACHGTEVDPGLLTEIQTLYPEDAATGFEPSQLRGAFTVTLPYASE